MSELLEEYVVTTFYKFTSVSDCYDLRAKFIRFCSEHDIKGTILLATEGINATIVGKRNAINLFYSFIKEIITFTDIQFQETFTSFTPFIKLKVKVKKEIVAFKTELNAIDPGQYLSPSEWDLLINTKSPLLIDARNHYEVAIGTFVSAINPNTNNFAELSRWLDGNLKDISKEYPIAMFCTGGIRCEKSTSYLKQQGYKNVYHLKGGIINYLKNTSNQSKLWNGRCFIFDDRLSLDTKLQPSW